MGPDAGQPLPRHDAPLGMALRSGNQLPHLRNQCAGFAYGWKKIAALPGIDGIQWHNWFDHRNEGTLRIGLRRYPDDAEDPGGKKPIWETYRDAGTDREEEAFAPFLSVIGIPDWNILQPVAD